MMTMKGFGAMPSPHDTSGVLGIQTWRRGVAAWRRTRRGEEDLMAEGDELWNAGEDAIAVVGEAESTEKRAPTSPRPPPLLHCRCECR
jgi:hypothetical protein